MTTTGLRPAAEVLADAISERVQSLLADLKLINMRMEHLLNTVGQTVCCASCDATVFRVTLPNRRVAFFNSDGSMHNLGCRIEP